MTAIPEEARRRSAPILTSGLDCEIAVVGAGIVGVCCALELQAAGFDVQLIDRKGVAEECSAGNAGHIAVEHIFPLATPATLCSLPSLLVSRNPALRLSPAYFFQVLPWLARFVWSARPAQVARATYAAAALNALVLPAYHDLDIRFGLNGLLREQGTLAVYETERGLTNALADVPILEQFGIEATTLDHTALHQHDPALSDQLVGGIMYPGSAHVTNPKALTHLLGSHFIRLGGNVKIATVTRAEHGSTHIRLHTSSGTIRSKKLVVAAGAWSHLLLKTLGWSIPLETERGYHLMARSPSVIPRVPTTHGERRFVATPMRDGLRLAGRVEFAGLSRPPTPSLAMGLLKHGQAMMPDLQAKTLKPWMGFRPTLPDSLPIIGPIPGQPDVYCAFGHHHLGLTQAAATGQLIRDLVLEGKTVLDISPYRLNRF